MKTKLVPLKVGDRVMLRKHWERYVQDSRSNFELRIARYYLREDLWYTIEKIGNESETPICKVQQGINIHIPYYYSRAIFRKITLPPNK